MNNQSYFCFVQLSRIGDILQTIRAIQIFGENFPKNRCIFVGRKNFSEPLQFLLDQFFCKTYLLDDQLLFFDLINQKKTFHQGIEKVHNFIEDINKNNITSCINITFSKPSSFLTGMIHSEFKWGPYYDQKYNLKIDDVWGQFIYSVIMGSSYSPFNLVDIYKEMIKDALEIEIDENHTFTNTNTKKKKRKDFKLIIHPFASQDKKRWPFAHWIKLMSFLINDLPNLEILIIGSQKDLDNHKEELINFEKNPSFKKVFNLVGKTSLDKLFKLVSESDLILGHDSMTGHMASLHNIPVITLSLGTVRPFETTPYGDNHFNIVPSNSCFPCLPQTNCKNYDCQQEVPYKTISYLINQTLEHQNIDLAILMNFPDKSITYKSNIKVNSFQSLKRLCNSPQKARNVFLTFYNVIWRYILKEEEYFHKFPTIDDCTHDELKSTISGIDYLHSLCQFGIQYAYNVIEQFNQSQNMSNHTIKTIQNHSAKISETENLILSLKNKFNHLAPIIDFYYVMRANVPGEGILMMASNSMHLFKEQEYSLTILKDFINETIKNYQKEKKFSFNPTMDSSPDN